MNFSNEMYPYPDCPAKFPSSVFFWLHAVSLFASGKEQEKNKVKRKEKKDETYHQEHISYKMD